MQDSIANTFEWLGPHAAEARAAATIVAILVLALVVRSVIGKASRLFFERIAMRAALVEEKRRIETLSRVTRRSLSVVVLLVAGMLVLNQLGVSIAPILGAAGVVGIAVGFGAQSLVKDFFTGIVLLIENQIRVGDVVDIAGLSGVVEEMSLRRIKLRSYDGSVHYVSNGLISTVTNRSTEYAFAVIDIGISYRDDIDTVFEVMRDVARQLQQAPEYQARLLGDLEIAGVDQLAESAVMIRCRIKTQPLEQWGVRREFLKRLKAAFDARGISLPFPHRTVIHQNAPASPAPATLHPSASE